MHASSSSFSATTWALHPATDSTTKYEAPLWSKHSICPWRAVEVGVVVSVVVVVGEVVNDEVGVVDVAVVVSVDVPVVDVVDVGVVVCVVLVVGVVVCDVVPVDVGEVVGVVISHSVNVPSWYESIAAFRTATVASHALTQTARELAFHPLPRVLFYCSADAGVNLVAFATRAINNQFFFAERCARQRACTAKA